MLPHNLLEKMSDTEAETLGCLIMLQHAVGAGKEGMITKEEMIDLLSYWWDES